MLSGRLVASICNPTEAELVAAIVAGFVERGAADVGVVTPYAAQAAVIAARLRLRGLEAIVEVSSVDGYQGREKDLVVLSAVRSNPGGRIGFVADPRRLNVAITRARSGLVVVGDATTLAAGCPSWAALFQWYAKSRKVLAADVVLEAISGEGRSLD